MHFFWWIVFFRTKKKKNYKICFIVSAGNKICNVDRCCDFQNPCEFGMNNWNEILLYVSLETVNSLIFQVVHSGTWQSLIKLSLLKFTKTNY